QNGADDGKHEGYGLIEKVRLHETLPRRGAAKVLDRGLQRGERVLVNIRPHRAHAADVQALVGDRFGAVVDQEDKSQRQQQKPDETKHETDHGLAALSAETGMRRPATEYPHHPARSMILPRRSMMLAPGTAASAWNPAR